MIFETNLNGEKFQASTLLLLNLLH